MEKPRDRGRRAISMLCCCEPGKLYRPSRLLSRCVITLIAACVQLEKESLSLILFQEIRRTRRYRREIESYLDDCLIPGARPIYFFLPLFLTFALSFFIFPFLRFDLSSSFLFPSSFFFSFLFFFIHESISLVYRYRGIQRKDRQCVCGALECR